MDYLSVFLILSSLIAIVAAVIRLHYMDYQRRFRKQEKEEKELSGTTAARMDFEAVEKELVAARMTLQIVNNAENPRPQAQIMAQENVEIAMEDWLLKLKQVLRLRRRVRSPSPESVQLYKRFTAPNEDERDT